MKEELITYEELKKTNLYPAFLSENPSTGTLKVQVFTAYKAVPIADCEIIIFKTIGDKKVVFFTGKTNNSGIIDNIILPAPENATATSMEAPLYTTYDMTAIHVGYETIKQYKIGMLGNIKVIQYVRMTPEVELEGVKEDGN